VVSDLSAALGIGLSVFGLRLPQSAPPSLSVFTPAEVEVVRPGTGDPLRPGDRVTLNLSVRTQDGKEIANTRKRGLAYTLVIGEDDAKPFWRLVLAGIRSGEERLVRVDAEAAFGPLGVPPVFLAQGELRASVEVLRVVRGQPLALAASRKPPR